MTEDNLIVERRVGTRWLIPEKNGRTWGTRVCCLAPLCKRVEAFLPEGFVLFHRVSGGAASAASNALISS